MKRLNGRRVLLLKVLEYSPPSFCTFGLIDFSLIPQIQIPTPNYGALDPGSFGTLEYCRQFRVGITNPYNILSIHKLFLFFYFLIQLFCRLSKLLSSLDHSSSFFPRLNVGCFFVGLKASRSKSTS